MVAMAGTNEMKNLWLRVDGMAWKWEQTQDTKMMRILFMGICGWWAWAWALSQPVRNSHRYFLVTRWKVDRYMHYGVGAVCVCCIICSIVGDHVARHWPCFPLGWWCMCCALCTHYKLSNAAVVRQNIKRWNVIIILAVLWKEYDTIFRYSKSRKTSATTMTMKTHVRSPPQNW